MAKQNQIHSTFYSAPRRKRKGELVPVLKHHGVKAYQEGEDKTPCILNTVFEVGK